MNKCAACGLLNLRLDTACKRCGQPLGLMPAPGAPNGTPARRGVSLVKVLLLLIGLSVIAVVALGAGAVWWFSNHRQSLEAEGVAARKEGRAFAAGKDDDQCVDESLRRTDACDELAFVCRARAGIFLDGCLAAGARTKGTCDGVPKTTELLKSFAWRDAVCKRHGQKDAQQCGQTLEHLQKFCDGEPVSVPQAR